MPGWSHCTKEVTWELLGSLFHAKTCLLAMVRKRGKVAKVQMVVDEHKKHHIGSNDDSYIPQPGSLHSTLELVAPAETENEAAKGKRRFEDAMLQLERLEMARAGGPCSSRATSKITSARRDFAVFKAV